jgi:hypothetical protein
MSSLPSALKSLDTLLAKCPDLSSIRPNTNYNGDTKPFGYLCEKHADEKVKEAMRRRHYCWNQQKQRYHIDKALFFAINTRLDFINESTESFYGTPEAFNVGKKLLQKVFHNKMEKLGWEKNEDANCWNYVGIENTTISEETTIPDEVSNDVSVVSMNTSVSEITQTLNLVRPSPTSGDSGIWSGVVQGFSDNTEIKMWEERLLKIKKKKKAFLDHPDYSIEHEKQQDKLAKLNEKIELCEKEIRSLKQDLLAEDSDSDDEW